MRGRKSAHALLGRELLAASRTQKSAAAIDDAADGPVGERLDVAVHETRKPQRNPTTSQLLSMARRVTDADGVHARRIPAAGQNADARLCD